jgi:hypothetical protein
VAIVLVVINLAMRRRIFRRIGVIRRDSGHGGPPRSRRFGTHQRSARNIVINFALNPQLAILPAETRCGLPNFSRGEARAASCLRPGGVPRSWAAPIPVVEHRRAIYIGRPHA